MKMKKNYTRLIPTILLLLVVNICLGQQNAVLPPAAFGKCINNNDSTQLLDVRTIGEFSTGHIKNALQADWKDGAEFYRRIESIDKNKPVYIYCLSGGRSAAAAQKMRDKGYTNVNELKGGLNAWKADNMEVEGSTNEKQMSLAELDNKIKASKTVLLDFGAEWCPPCKKMEPVLARLQANNPGKFSMIKIDGGKDQEIMQKYGVIALPVFIVIKNGKQVWRKEGLAGEKEIAAQL